jgi:hypothetical protein
MHQPAKPNPTPVRSIRIDLGPTAAFAKGSLAESLQCESVHQNEEGPDSESARLRFRTQTAAAT